MKIEKRKINFEDDRGKIIDIFFQKSVQHATIIYSKKGSVRGNHYHKKTTQIDFIVSGRMRVLVQKIGEEDVSQAVVSKNDLITYEPSEAHAFIAEEDTIFVTFANGPRGGENYESDTFRLDIPLQDKSVTRLIS